MTDQTEEQGVKPETAGEQPAQPEKGKEPEAQRASDAAATAVEDKIAQLERKLRNKTEEAQRFYEKLQAIEQAEEAEMSELELLRKKLGKTEEQLTAAEALLKQRELVDMQTRAASEAGIPVEFAGRLQGENYDEMLADAQKLAELLPKPENRKPQVAVTNPPGGRVGQTEEQFRHEMGMVGSRTPSIWQPGGVGGGGVVFPELEE